MSPVTTECARWRRYLGAGGWGAILTVLMVLGDGLCPAPCRVRSVHARGSADHDYWKCSRPLGSLELVYTGQRNQRPGKQTLPISDTFVRLGAGYQIDGVRPLPS